LWKESTMKRTVAGMMAVLAASLAPNAASAVPLGTGFTYQGRLSSTSGPAPASADFVFTLHDALTMGNQVAGPVSRPNVVVVNGLFTVEVDFGSTVFDGQARWLGIQVRAPAGSGGYTPLAPRQPLTAVPYALHANGPWRTSGNNIFNSNTGNVGIGTQAPTARLHVLGGGLFVAKTGPDPVGTFHNSAVSFSGGTTAAAQIAVESRAQTGLGSPVESRLILEAESTTGGGQNVARVRAENRPLQILSSQLSVIGNADFTGNLGVGTSSPGAKLDLRQNDTTRNGIYSLLGQTAPNLPNPPDEIIPLAAVRGDADSNRIGVIGTSFRGIGVYGYNQLPNDACCDVRPGIGVYARTDGYDSYGLYAVALGNCSTAVFAIAPELCSWAAQFVGNAGFDGNVWIRGEPSEMPPDSPALNVSNYSSTAAHFSRDWSDGVILSFSGGASTAIKGTISLSGEVVSYNAFTGSHYAWTDEPLEYGHLVSMTGRNRRLRDEPKAEPIYGITASGIANDSRCLGAYLGPQEPSRPAGPENPLLVMAVGNGEMWVTSNDQGDIRPGDYLISSDLPGCAMKDDPQRFPVGYIAARAAEGVDWKAVEPIGGRKRVRISVLFENFVRDSKAPELRKIVEAQQKQIKAMQDENARMKQQLSALLDEVRQLKAGLQTGGDPMSLAGGPVRGIPVVAEAD
jgi:hypothetical protein